MSPEILMSPVTLSISPLNVRLLSAVAFGAAPFRVRTPLFVFPVRDRRPDVPDVPDEPFSPLIPDVPDEPFAPLTPDVPLVPFPPEAPSRFVAQDAYVPVP